MTTNAETTLNELSKITGTDYVKVRDTIYEILDMMSPIYREVNRTFDIWKEGSVYVLRFQVEFLGMEKLNLLKTDIFFNIFHLLYKPTHYTPVINSSYVNVIKPKDAENTTLILEATVDLEDD